MQSASGVQSVETGTHLVFVHFTFGFIIFNVAVLVTLNRFHPCTVGEHQLHVYPSDTAKQVVVSPAEVGTDFATLPPRAVQTFDGGFSTRLASRGAVMPSPKINRVEARKDCASIIIVMMPASFKSRWLVRWE